MVADRGGSCAIREGFGCVEWFWLCCWEEVVVRAGAGVTG
jgi:hypothetical protein